MLGLPNKTLSVGQMPLGKNTMSFDTKSTLEVFKNCYSTLAVNFLKMLHTSHNKYTFHSIKQYYRQFTQSNAFN